MYFSMCLTLISSLAALAANPLAERLAGRGPAAPLCAPWGLHPPWGIEIESSMLRLSLPSFSHGKKNMCERTGLQCQAAALLQSWGCGMHFHKIGPASKGCNLRDSFQDSLRCLRLLEPPGNGFEMVSTCFNVVGVWPAGLPLQQRCSTSPTKNRSWSPSSPCSTRRTPGPSGPGKGDWPEETGQTWPDWLFGGTADWKTNKTWNAWK